MDLPITEFSLGEFCRQARDYVWPVPDKHTFIKFVLNGLFDGRQVVLNPLLDRPEAPNLKLVRDYDSLLGIDRHVRVHGELTLNVLGKVEDVLRTNIHLKHAWNHQSAPVHKIPNIGIGKWGVHTLLRILIPGLYTQDGGSSVSADDLRVFYDLGFYPAIRQLMGDQANDWPASYQAEVFRAQGSNGKFQIQTKMFPEHLVPQLGDALREALVSNGVEWGESIVFLHQVRGVKNTSVHRVYPAAIDNAFADFLDSNRLVYQELIANGRWWVDVGLEAMSRSGECLAWRTDSHRHVVGRILRINEYRADKITRPTSSKYTRDLTSHMPQVSGCRVAPGAHGEGDCHARYVQLYQTDKSVTAHKEGFQHGKFVNGAAVLDGKGVKYLEQLYDLYVHSCRTVQAHARAEVRIPIEHYSVPFLNVTPTLMGRSLVTFPKNFWWGLRAFRALAYQYLIDEMGNAAPKFRLKDEALLLMASAPWFVNSLHSTPDLGQSHRDLLTNILPHIRKEDADLDVLPFVTSIRDADGNASDYSTDSEDEYHPRHVAANANTVPCMLHGLLFINPLKLGEGIPCPRFQHNGRFIKDQTFKHIFGKELDDVQSIIYGGGMVQKSNPDRVRNKVRRTTRYIPEENEAPIFNLAAQGYHLEAPGRDDGSDNEAPDSDDEEEVDMFLQDIDMQLSVLWRQFLLDMTEKAPNMSGAGQVSYIKLNKLQRRQVDEDTYKNKVLSEYFKLCQWKIPDDKGWDIIFGHLWPEKDVTKFAAQNYGQSDYYVSWGRLLDRCPDDNTIKKVRRELRKRFNKLFWVPHAYPDKIWWTKNTERDRSGFTITQGVARAAPRVAVRHTPDWVLQPSLQESRPRFQARLR
ncbi:hypothetical protein BDZ97DRAFT_1667945 [Flammula alnicola]|nr:hypothetical protein BDZ97DRAFT_1923373 [Flammula alnicola]KAF8958914.1 hypothetical protein BDZ97DRAFT_1667945 [Flammula alnicola]